MSLITVILLVITAIETATLYYYFFNPQGLAMPLSSTLKSSAIRSLSSCVMNYRP
ncbi:hypothetical protein Nmel_003053 [Mimus melanotis]